MRRIALIMLLLRHASSVAVRTALRRRRRIESCQGPEARPRPVAARTRPRSVGPTAVQRAIATTFSTQNKPSSPHSLKETKEARPAHCW